ncbi:MAG: SUMF1/EgtB/PvdO family nonheme iron enzyme [Calditrichia bacterium]|jgi:formylglycine-generating enzyme required for sulfatase activity|nr:SUMF1/EgtB/PvdO family nonheme iron enzyme [Calditrichia bacterium]
MIHTCYISSVFRFVFISFSIMVVYSGCENAQIPNDKNNYIEPEMILIDKDLTFTNGPSWDSTVYEIVDSLPVITLEPYYISKYELTNEEYYLFVKDGGYINPVYWSDTGWKSKNDSNWTKPKYWGEGEKPWEEDPFSNKKNTPVHAISFYEAEAYCDWLTDKTGKNYRIPYFTEWVRAAKGPDPGTKYPWGNEFIEANAHYPIYTYSNLVPVSNYSNGRSHEGCYNMIGNAYEICFRIPDEWGDFLLIHSFHNLECSVPKCMKETMTTTNGGFIEKETRSYAVGLRICRD